MLEQHAGVVDQVARGEVVGAVDHDVVVLEDVEGVLAGERDFVLDDLHVRIDVQHVLAGGVELLAADVLGAVNDLALQVGEIDDVEIDQADFADAGGGQVQAERRAQSARADQQHVGGLELQLAFHADFGHDQVARVAEDFVLRERDPGGARSHRTPPAMQGTIDSVSPSATGVASFFR